MINAQLMVQPSFFIDTGTQITSIKGIHSFKFSTSLQERLENLNEKKRTANLDSDEELELIGILELDRIFTLINAKIIAER